MIVAWPEPSPVFIHWSGCTEIGFLGSDYTAAAAVLVKEAEAALAEPDVPPDRGRIAVRRTTQDGKIYAHCICWQSEA